MVAGVRTQYENIRAVPPPAGFAVDTVPITPYQEGGAIERLPLLRWTHKGTLRSAIGALPLLARSYDVMLTQVTLPLLPLLAACDAHLKRRPAIVYTIDTTPRLMDAVYDIYYGVPAAGARKRAIRDRLQRYVLDRCAAVAPWSTWAARSFHDDYGVPDERIHVIPPGVDLQEWTVPPHRLEGLPPSETGPFKLLFVGADYARKGGPLLLDTFRRHLTGRCELYLVTKEDLASEPGVHVYRGFGPNEPGLRELYARCDALVLPTRADCFSLASIEAMACGLPVISCPVGGIPEIVRQGETGFLVPPDDGRALLEAIEALVANRPLALEMGLAGRQIVEERFDGATNADALFGLFRRLAPARRR